MAEQGGCGCKSFLPGGRPGRTFPYDSLPGEFPFVRGNGKTTNEWLVRQDIVVEDPAEANKKALIF